jgi:hypothetical protein
MAASTTNVEIDTHLLEALRALDPGRDDRELVEELARDRLRFEGLRATQSRSTLDDDDAMRIATEAVHAARRDMR